MHSKPTAPRVVIVGGSIAGCLMAIELGRIGCELTVLERSPNLLHDRGAALAFPSNVYATLRERDLIDAEIPCLRSTHCARVVRADPIEHAGRLIWRQPTDVVHLRWHALFEQLRKRVPEACYQRGCTVTSFEQNDRGVTLQLAGGRTLGCDLVVFADGYRSVGRSALFPDSAPRYAGYVLWRGVLPEPPSEQFGHGLRLTTIGYGIGHGVFYLVPGPDGSNQPGARSVYWALYMRASARELPALLTDSAGTQRSGSLPPDALPSERSIDLANRLCPLMPNGFAQLVRSSSRTFLQAIFDGPVPHYRSGRVLLAGDAGALAPPTSGTGVLKSVHDAARLAELLGTSGSLASALVAWDDERTRWANHAVEYGRQLARALVLEIPDWSPMTPASMWHWMSSIVTHWDAVTPLAEQRGRLLNERHDS
jgi:2-polyprenyl-6-methoxyphenol hydroxylase-like FAD-dependent oxidoreductase